jgi:hypothetical protein
MPDYTGVRGMNQTEYKEMVQEVYKTAYIDGLTAYSWMQDGKTYVGTCGTTLREAIEKVEKTWNYRPQ